MSKVKFVKRRSYKDAPLSDHPEVDEVRRLSVVVYTTKALLCYMVYFYAGYIVCVCVGHTNEEILSDSTRRNELGSGWSINNN